MTKPMLSTTSSESRLQAVLLYLCQLQARAMLGHDEMECSTCILHAGRVLGEAARTTLEIFDAHVARGTRALQQKRKAGLESFGCSASENRNETVFFHDETVTSPAPAVSRVFSYLES